jgi:hypothetical protein
MGGAWDESENLLLFWNAGIARSFLLELGWWENKTLGSEEDNVMGSGLLLICSRKKKQNFCTIFSFQSNIMKNIFIVLEGLHFGENF